MAIEGKLKERLERSFKLIVESNLASPSVYVHRDFMPRNLMITGLPVDEDFGAFYRAVEWMGLQRHLKVAGIFARLTLRDGKPRYLADTPRFIAYIRATASRYMELTPLLRVIDEVEGSTAVTGFAYGRV